MQPGFEVKVEADGMEMSGEQGARQCEPSSLPIDATTDSLEHAVPLIYAVDESSEEH